MRINNLVYWKVAFLPKFFREAQSAFVDAFNSFLNSSTWLFIGYAGKFMEYPLLVCGSNPNRLVETGSYGKFTRTRRQFLMLMADYVTHHRAQMLVYLRLKAIVPPNYVEFQ